MAHIFFSFQSLNPKWDEEFLFRVGIRIINGMMMMMMMMMSGIKQHPYIINMLNKPSEKA